MEQAPVTRQSLLIRIQDPSDAQAWREFFRLYASIVYGFARKRGLQDADAADLMQEVLRTVASAVGKLNYDPSKGSFRAWLYTVTRNKIYNFLHARRRHELGAGDSNAQERLAEFAGRQEDAVEVWEREYEQRIFDWAIEQVRQEFHDGTWRAFWLTAMEGLSAKEAGARLGLSPGAVYVAKSRVLARLKERVQQVREE